MKHNFIVGSQLLVLALFATACSTPATPSSLSDESSFVLKTEKDGGVIDYMNEIVAGYMSLPFEESRDYITTNAYRVTKKANDGQWLRLVWGGGTAPYTCRISTDSGMNNPIERKTDRKFCFPGNLYPNTDYYYQVEDSSGNKTEVGHFKSGDGPRLITARSNYNETGVNNVRDMGGWKTEDGKTVNYDKVFRGGLLYSTNATSYNLDDYGKVVMDELGIKSEIDFRKKTESGNQTESPLDGCAYYNYEYLPYDAIFDGSKYEGSTLFDDRAPGVIKSVFDLMQDESNYPLYIHCHAGQDRTGTMAWLINGMLGVSYEDLTRDYELTAFSKVGEMWRGTSFSYSYIDETGASKLVKEENTWVKMNETMMSVYGTGDSKLSSAIKNYLKTECNVTDQMISKVEGIMLR